MLKTRHSVLQRMTNTLFIENVTKYDDKYIYVTN